MSSPTEFILELGIFVKVIRFELNIFLKDTPVSLEVLNSLESKFNEYLEQLQGFQGDYDHTKLEISSKGQAKCERYFSKGFKFIDHILVLIDQQKFWVTTILDCL